MATTKPAIFFDRDGIVNIGCEGYITSIAEFQFRIDFFPLFQWAKAQGFLAIIISNQQGVGKGLMTAEDLATIHRYMQQELLLRTGYTFDDIFTCTQLKTTTDEGCHKPNPVMIEQAIVKWNIRRSHSWIIGDQQRDIEAGQRAGIHTCFVNDTLHLPTADYCCADLLAARNYLQHWFTSHSH